MEECFKNYLEENKRFEKCGGVYPFCCGLKIVLFDKEDLHRKDKEPDSKQHLLLDKVLIEMMIFLLRV